MCTYSIYVNLYTYRKRWLSRLQWGFLFPQWNYSNATCRTKHSIPVTTETALQRERGIERDGNGDRQRERKEGEMERDVKKGLSTIPLTLAFSIHVCECVCVCGSGREAGGHVLSEGRRSASWAISTEMIRAGRSVRGVATETGVREVEERILKDTWIKSSLLTRTHRSEKSHFLYTHLVLHASRKTHQEPITFTWTNEEKKCEKKRIFKDKRRNEMRWRDKRR